MSSSMSRFAAETSMEAAQAVPLRSQEDAKAPIIALLDVALMSGMRVKGSWSASTTCAMTSILQEHKLLNAATKLAKAPTSTQSSKSPDANVLGPCS